MPDHVLVINCGSSSIKFSLVDPGSGEHVLSGLAERVGSENARLVWKGAEAGERDLGRADHDAAMGAIVGLLR